MSLVMTNGDLVFFQIEITLVKTMILKGLLSSVDSNGNLSTFGNYLQ